MSFHLYIGTEPRVFPGDGTFTGFAVEPGDTVDDDVYGPFAAAQPDLAARFFDDTTSKPVAPEPQQENE